jgi:hypothetical protein
VCGGGCYLEREAYRATPSAVEITQSLTILCLVSHELYGVYKDQAKNRTAHLLIEASRSVRKNVF